MSLALASPGHQLTIPDGGAVQGPGLGDGDGLGEGDGPVTGKHCENSEVLPNSSIAVAVITFPAANATGMMAAFAPVNPALQLLSVVTVLDPRNVRPSPKLLGAVSSQKSLT